MTAQVQSAGELAETQTAEQSAARRPHRILQIGAAILLPVVILVIVEVSLRIAGVGFSTNLLVPCTVKGTPASCYNLFFATPYFPAGMVQTPRLYSIPTTKSPGTFAGSGATLRCRRSSLMRNRCRLYKASRFGTAARGASGCPRRPTSDARARRTSAPGC